MLTIRQRRVLMGWKEKHTQLKEGIDRLLFTASNNTYASAVVIGLVVGLAIAILWMIFR